MAKRFGWHSGALTCKSVTANESGITNTISGSLTITQNLTLTGNMTVAGTFTFGDAATDALTVTGILNQTTSISTADNLLEQTVTTSCTSGTVIGHLCNIKNTGSGATVYGIQIQQHADSTQALACALRIVNAASDTITVGVDFQNAGTLTTGIAFSQAVTTAISIAGASTTGISITGNATDAIRILTGTFTDAIDIAGTTTNAINISGAVTTGLLVAGATTTGVSITGNATDGIKIATGTFTDAIEIAGTTTNGINIGACTTAIAIAGATTTGIAITGNATTAMSIATGTFTTGISITGTTTTAISAVLTAAGTGINIDAGTTDHTGATIITCDLDVNSANVRFINADIDVGTALSSGENVYGVYLDVDGAAGDDAGSGMTGLYLTSANTTAGVNTGVNVAGTWDTGVLIASTSVMGLDSQTKARIGTHDWGVGATGVVLNGTDPDFVFQTAGRINAAVSSGAFASCYNQLAVTITQANNVSCFAQWAELYITGGTIDLSSGSNYAAIWGNLEISGTVTSTNSSCYMAAVVGTLITPSTWTNNTITAGVVADSNITSGNTNNLVMPAFAAIVSASHPTKANWDAGLYIDGADNVLIFETGTNYEDGAKIASITVDSATALAGVLRVKCRSTATAYYVPLFVVGDLTGA